MSGNPLLARRATAILLGLALAGLGGCSSGESKAVGGAWPSQPVKCSAYQHDRAQYESCLARDREASTPASRASVLALVRG